MPIKTFFLFIILIILTACQGRNMPKLDTVKKSLEKEKYVKFYTEMKTTTIKKVPKKKVIIFKKKISNNKHKVILPKIIMPLQGDKKNHKVKLKPKINTSLPPLPNIPSVDEINTPKKPLTPTTANNKINKTESLVNTLINTKVPLPNKTFSGGGMAENLDMANIRIGNSSDYTSVIFDTYVDNKKSSLPTKKAPISGTYLFTYEPSKNRIVGILDGYNTYSALSGGLSNLLKNSPVLKNIYVLDYLGTDGIKFIIELHAKVRVNIFDVKNPGRIIVNLFPL